MSTSPNQNKLDRIDPDQVWLHKNSANFFAKMDGLAHAAPYTQYDSWITGMMTTQYSENAFMAQTGDLIEARVKLRADRGAWPSFFTWVPTSAGLVGNGRLDIFEYHSDYPRRLLVKNWNRDARPYSLVQDIVNPGEWHTIGAQCNSDDVTYYVDGSPIFSDGVGVEANWSAYIGFNLSIANGLTYASPVLGTMLRFHVDWVKVTR